MRARAVSVHPLAVCCLRFRRTTRVFLPSSRFSLSLFFFFLAKNSARVVCRRSCFRVSASCRGAGEGDTACVVVVASLPHARKNVCRRGFSVIRGDERGDLCDQCDLLLCRRGGTRSDIATWISRDPHTKMKLEYPCRVEGWLNVCGECTRCLHVTYECHEDDLSQR